MASTSIIRQFETTEWQSYKDLRLNALKESPEAFGSIYEDAVKYEDINWRNRLAHTSAENDYPMVALVGDEFAGLAWVMVDPPEINVAHLYQMWVEVTCGDRPARRLYDSLGFVPTGDPVPVWSDSDRFEQLMELRFRVDNDE